jgi:hypothetical protein
MRARSVAERLAFSGVLMSARELLENAVQRIDGELRRLIGTGAELSSPGLLDRLRAAGEAYRRQEPERKAARQEADQLLPHLLDLYTRDSDDDRAWVRDLLHGCPSFRWAVGWEVAWPTAPISVEEAAKALVLFSMKDGGADPRDQKVWLDGFCSSLRETGLGLPVLLRQAAELSSGVPRFAPMSSTRTLLLATAQRLSATPSA